MGKKDLTYMLGGDGGRTRQKYRCKADGCQVTPMGVKKALQGEHRLGAFEGVESLCGGCSAEKEAGSGRSSHKIHL